MQKLFNSVAAPTMARMYETPVQQPQAGPPQQTGLTAAQVQAQQATQAIAVNDQVTRYVLAESTEVWQSIYSEIRANPANGNNVINVPFRAVGLIKGFVVKVNATIHNATGGVISLTDWNAANILSNVTLYDLDNYQRINTAGWYLNMLATAKEGFPHAAALLSTAMDSPVKYGNNFNVNNASATIADGADGTLQFYYWVPCAYSATDLRGAIFSGVVNATGQLQLTVNPTPGVATASDGTLAVYKSAAASAATTVSSVTVQVYQVYLDQLPRYAPGTPQAGAPILPPLAMATQYRINTTALTGPAVNQDFPVPFTNFQQFLSLGIIYDQAGTLAGGTDINYFAMSAANTYLPFKLDPTTQAFRGRHKILTDWPKGSYLFDFRGQPINTNQTGNMQLLLNAITAAAGTTVLCGFEALALTNTVLGAASLPAG